jgi:predicted TIM-barrel fold metal-dependent hydrolase
MTSRSFTASVPVMDANVGVGHKTKRPAPFDTPDELMTEMQRHGVERALVHHQSGETASSIDANDLLTDWCGGDARLTYQWTAAPEADSLKQLQELRADGKIDNVRLHDCAASGLPFVDWLYGDLLEWLQAEKIPLWISMANEWDPTWLSPMPMTPVTEIMETLRKFPDLVTVLVGAHYSHAHFVRPFLKLLPNCYIELSRYEVLADLEKVIAEYGARRFVYGSFYPRYAAGPMLFYIHNIGLSEADLKGICAGNLEAILEGGAK